MTPLVFAGWDAQGRELPYRRLQELGDVVRPRALREVGGGRGVRGLQVAHLVERGDDGRVRAGGAARDGLRRERQRGRDELHGGRQGDGRGGQRDARNRREDDERACRGETSLAEEGYLALRGFRQRARAMAGDAGRALRTLAAAIADGVGRAVAEVEGVRDGRRDGRVRWRPRFGDG